MIPSDDIEMDAMTKLKNQITKIQDEYMIKNKKSLIYQCIKLIRN